MATTDLEDIKVQRDGFLEYWIGEKKVTQVHSNVRAWKDVSDTLEVPFRNKILENRELGGLLLSADLGRNQTTTATSSVYVIAKKVTLRVPVYLKAVEVNPVKQHLRLKIRSEEGTPVAKEVIAALDGLVYKIGRYNEQIRAGILLDEDFAGASIYGWVSRVPVNFSIVRGFTERPHSRRRGIRNYTYVGARVYNTPTKPVGGWIAEPDVRESIIYGFIDGASMIALTATTLTNTSAYPIHITTKGARFKIDPGMSAVIPGIQAYRSLLDRFKMNDPYISATRMHRIFSVVDLRLTTLLIERTQPNMSSILSYYASIEKPIVITELA